MENTFQKLNERGLIAQITSPDVLTPKFTEQRVAAYIGFDLTAPSLHVGSLIQLMVLRQLAEDGHRPIVLLGDTTTQVGDPSGKDKSRPMLSTEEISKNFLGIEKAIKRIVPDAEIITNGEWFDDMRFMTFMRELGPHFTINRMVGFDTVKRRLEEQQPMTFLEFTYMILQAADFLELFQREGCSVQIGGSDQWGNIVNGVELVRKVEGETVFGVTTPLLTTKDGKKMGKSVSGAVWLDPELTAPFDFFQFWRNVEDEKVEEFEKMFTAGPPQGAFGEALDINTRKERLAFEVTALVHGEDTAKSVLHKVHAVFKHGDAVVESEVLEGETVSQVIHRLGFAKSRTAARHLITGNAVSIDGEKISEDIIAPTSVILKVGKKQSAKLV